MSKIFSLDSSEKIDILCYKAIKVDLKPLIFLYKRPFWLFWALILIKFVYFNASAVHVAICKVS